MSGFGITILGYGILGHIYIMTYFIAIVLRYDNIVSVYCIIVLRI